LFFFQHVLKPNPVVAIPPILLPQVKNEPKKQAKHSLDQFIQNNPQKQKEKQMPKLTPNTVRTPQEKIVTPKPTPNRRKQPFTKLLSSSNDSEAQFSPPPKVKKPLKTYGKSKWKRKSRAKPRLDFNDPINDLNLRTPDGSVPFENFTITDNFRIIVNAGQKRVFVSKEVAAATSKVCEKCGFKGRTLTDLTDHARTHSKEKPFKCPVGICINQRWDMYVFIGEPKFSSIGYKVGARFRLSYKYINVRSLVLMVYSSHIKQKRIGNNFFNFQFFSGVSREVQ
jgi:uncharacterized Zn-finger protein